MALYQSNLTQNYMVYGSIPSNTITWEDSLISSSTNTLFINKLNVQDIQNPPIEPTTPTKLGSPTNPDPSIEPVPTTNPGSPIELDTTTKLGSPYNPGPTIKSGPPTNADPPTNPGPPTEPNPHAIPDNADPQTNLGSPTNPDCPTNANPPANLGSSTNPDPSTAPNPPIYPDPPTSPESLTNSDPPIDSDPQPIQGIQPQEPVHEDSIETEKPNPQEQTQGLAADPAGENVTPALRAQHGETQDEFYEESTETEQQNS